MAVLEYMLIREVDRMRTPSWIEDGGYFYDPDNFTMVGWSPDEGQREYYVPDSVLELTKAQLSTRLLDIHSRYPMQKRNEETFESTTMTEQEVVALSDQWYDSKQGV